MRADTAPADTVVSTDPADGSTVGEFEVFDEAAVAAAVARARAATTWWQAQGLDGRLEHLSRWRKEIWKRADEFADLIHRENGKPVEDGILEVVLVVEHLRWAAKNAGKALGTRRVSPGILFANYTATVAHEPLGVVGIISPWNYPLYLPNSSSAFAMAAGNTVVLKPSEYTPAIAAKYVETFYIANPDAPTGVIELVTGYGATGSALCNAGVDKIGFTGSTATGKRVMAQCAQTLTPVLLECGGKDPVIVADDANIGAAATAIAWGGFTNAGQTCVGVERVYVHEKVAEPFLAALRGELDGVRGGSDAGATYGPMTMPAQVDVVRRHVDDALAQGARAFVGGRDSVGSRVIQPVVLLDTPEDSSAVREETFGPTITVRVVADIDEAVALSNDSDYALGASVFSRKRGPEIAERLRAGQVSINSVVAFAGMGAVPMGGVGESGIGRVHGLEGLLEFTRVRSVVHQRFPIPGFQLVSLRRAKHVMPILRRVVSLRHG